MANCLEQHIGTDFALYNGDCCEVIQSIPDESIHLSVFSPPFADLYAYSDSPRDMGNCRNYDEFFIHFGVLIEQLMRVLVPGRICAVHCMDIPSMKERDGVIGVKDFSGDIIRAFQRAGFVYHSRTLIWKDPLIEATRTKAIGLMHKQLCKDSTMSRCGLPDYLLAFRKPGQNPLPVEHPDGLTEYHGADDPGEHGVKRSHNIWRAYASPVWMDVRQTNTLNFREAREEKDEKHVCPLQLDTIARAVTLWSNPGEVVLTPFAGVGSEAYGAVKLGRRGIGIELKPSYYKQAVKNLMTLENKKEQVSTGSLF
jgi:DNA modification methylase